MAKFYGVIGYAERQEIEPGYWDDVITERECTGDLIRNYKKAESSGGVNDNVNIANEISIVADPYATEHFFAMAYIKFKMPKLGGTWKINTAEVAYPRITISLGGVWNGNTAGTTSKT